jgi:leucyl-tRNA synthetase
VNDRYDFDAVERTWQDNWVRSNAFQVTEDPSREKFYLLEMFPYPSGRIHMGHVRNYTIGDVVARQKTMRGYNVLHPIGWDAFGLPAENAAIQNRVHPAEWTRKNIDSMKKQLRRLGLSYDWDREFATCDPEYYRWNQWIFLKMHERGLVYRRKTWVNWCEKCQTTLANEQVVGGLCWRHETPVVQREMDAWFLRITQYAEELLADLD